MSEALWAQRPAPDAGSPVTWRAAPACLADLTALRGRLRAELRGRIPEHAGAEAAEWLVLAFEELASNGLRHGRAPVQVVVSETGRGWALNVSDMAAGRPRRRSAGIRRPVVSACTSWPGSAPRTGG